MKTLHTPVFLLILMLAPLSAAADELSPNTTTTVQQAWKLLDYMATDYTAAVAANGGKVINKAEYAEMQEFSATVVKLLKQLPQSAALNSLQTQAHSIAKAVNKKSPPPTIAKQAHKLASSLLKTYPIPSAPKNIPNLNLGAEIYKANCITCHGVNGNGQGPLAAGLEPPPIAFSDTARADMRSPLSLYQALSQGIEGTSMVSYKDVLSKQQRWDVAYYIGILAYKNISKDGEKIWKNNKTVRAHISDLDELSNTRVEQLKPILGQKEARAVIGWLRNNPQAVKSAPKGIDLARIKLSASLEAYKDGDSKRAISLSLSAYLDGVEPVEPLLETRSSGLRSQIEIAMGAYRTSLANQGNLTIVQKKADAADALLVKANNLLANSATSPSMAFIGAFTILVREGLEALLVVVALLAFLYKAKRYEAVRYVHYGWVLALIAGAITWAAATYLVSISGASRELTEGFAALFAAAVLLAVGLWMHQKSIGGRWQQYLKQKMDAALNRRTGWFLFVLAFVSVYREVFETILFYVALWSDGQHVWMLGGIISGAIVLVAIAWLLMRTSRRLPLSQFFTASSALIALLAFVMVGKGVAALQEAGIVSVSLVSSPHINWLGIYPTTETLTAQAAVVVLLVIGAINNYRKSEPTKESSAKTKAN